MVNRIFSFFFLTIIQNLKLMNKKQNPFFFFFLNYGALFQIHVLEWLHVQIRHVIIHTKINYCLKHWNENYLAIN